jgi:hypothetical protein
MLVIGVAGASLGTKVPLGCLSNEVGVRGCHSLVEGFVVALRLLLPRRLSEVAPYCTVPVCLILLFASV